MTKQKAGSEHKDIGFVQVERESLKPWGQLIRQSPVAAHLLMELVRHMDGRNAVVMSRKTMAQLMEVSERTIYRVLQTLREHRYVELVRIGNLHAVVVNARVGWTRSRGAKADMAVFDARVVANLEEQDTPPTSEPLRRVPLLMEGEEPILPDPESGEQAGLPGIEPERGDLEAGRARPAMWTDADGQQWEIDPETGEQQQRLDDAPNASKKKAAAKKKGSAKR